MKKVLSESYYFEEDAGVLTLCKVGAKDSGLSIDFSAEVKEFIRQKISPSKDLLAKAVGFKKNLKIADLTLGMAQDALKLAYFGAQVTGVESQPWVFALLENALLRAQEVPAALNLSLVQGDAREVFKTLIHDHEVFYIDPMFSHKRKALPKKAMQYLAEIAGESDEAAFGEIILQLQSLKKRAVVKRADKAPLLCGLKPLRQVKGKLVRFDIY